MSSQISTVIRHWSSLRCDGTIPQRSNLQPHALAAALPNAFLLERPRPDMVRFRLAGQHLHHTMGMDVRGMPLRAFFEIPDRKLLMERANRVFTDPAILDLELVSDSQGRAHLEGRMCLLPLRGADGQINRALGVLATDGLIGLTPRRFRIRHSNLSLIQSEQAVSCEFQETAAVWRGRPDLRVVQGGKA